MPHLTVEQGNPHSDHHAEGWRAADAIANARGQIAEAVGADPDEIIFTSGATEANNLAILGLCDRPDTRNRIIVSAIEHKSVLAPARSLISRGFELCILPVGADGVVDAAILADALDDHVFMISIQLVNNEIGAVQPIQDLAAMASKAGAIVHCDAAQAMAWNAPSVNELGVDLLSVSGHKMGGPKGVGALYARHGVRESLRPLILGGEQEQGLRAGTLPTPLCVGLGTACSTLPSVGDVQAWSALRDRLHFRLGTHRPDMLVYGPKNARHPGNLCLRFPGVEADRLIALLQPNLAISRGSACSSGMPEPSHVLRALGLDAIACNEVIRISIGPSNSEDEIDRAVDMMLAALTDLEKLYRS
jgi:cysteine desulfurase